MIHSHGSKRIATSFNKKRKQRLGRLMIVNGSEWKLVHGQKRARTSTIHHLNNAKGLSENNEMLNKGMYCFLSQFRATDAERQGISGLNALKRKPRSSARHQKSSKTLNERPPLSIIIISIHLSKMFDLIN